MTAAVSFSRGLWGFLVVAGLAAARAVAAAPPQDARFALTNPEAASVRRCRAAFPAAARNPGATGGWLYLSGSSGATLCLYGNLGTLDLARESAQLTKRRINRLVLRSAGGEVAAWLGLAEVIAGHVDETIVDGACFSSCANYGFPLGRSRLVPRGALVVWHGGPTHLVPDPTVYNGRRGEPGYRQLALRTDRLYRRLGISPAILARTARTPSAAKLRKIRKIAPQAEGLAGYAVPPAQLRCYGFTNLGRVWHPGDESRLIRFALQRLGRYVVAEGPDASDNCRKTSHHPGP